LLVALVVVGGWWYLRPRPRAVSSATEEHAAPTAANRSALPKSSDNLAEKRTLRDEQSVRTDDVKLAADEQVIIPGTPDPKAEPTRRSDASVFHFGASADAEPNEPQTAPSDPTATRASSDTRTGNSTIAEARRLLDTGQVIEARHQLNAVLKGECSEAEGAEVRSLLTRIADDTLFSRRSVPNDPLVDSYTVQPGDVLLNISKNYDVPYEILMTINGIPDPTKIRQDQKLKVLRGPFHARIYKSKFRMDVYLQDLFVRSFRVGLGTENGTPEGVWKVKNRLENPTYYPPASATDKRIIPPDDPNNPLGKRWIGLDGIEGQALGHEGYGIHGTIEPATIGQAVSLGCIRMHNEDVAFLYMLVMPGRSTVTILP
jgi:LysM repeat protein